ncbi:MAG: hypothetical protein PHX39_08465 [Bacteroidales bacterium]|nr:hypothetical protein [Bacteroidales bacterium]MDD3526969.1 hypothetical protein [Bacteroidales bacterium]MDD4742264.1 hypothetical protein [Bacteroidales bacterium]NCU35313.1 hypothetical protein [Candidatus Falkowbacteria bacterium]
MKMKFTPLLLLTLLLLIFQSCHDLELVRIAAVETSRATVFDNSSVELTGAIIDAGEPDDMFGYGFVYSTNPMPTNANQKTEAGTSSAAGAYQSTITNLTPGTWYFRAFVNTSSNGYTYGDVMTFTITQQAATELYWGTGVPDDYVGYNLTGPYMPLLYFDKASLQPYNGYEIVSMHFFPGSSYPESYSIYLEQAISYEQDVLSPVAGTWNEIYLEQPFFIDADYDLIAGYWVFNQGVNSFPCGIDAGPAYTGYGDLLFFEGSLYTSDFDANWCIKLILRNRAGKQAELSHYTSPPSPTDKDKPRVSQSNKSVLPLNYSQSKNANR